MILLKLFLLFCGFGLLCLNGGGSLLQFYIDELVTARQWLTLEELGNFMAVSQVTPGPIGVNLATFLGFRQAGWAGGLAATIGLLTPSMILMSLATRFYQKGEKSRVVRSLMFGVKPVTVALVASALIACLGMSIFSEQIPIDYFVRKLAGSPDRLQRRLLRPECGAAEDPERDRIRPLRLHAADGTGENHALPLPLARKRRRRGGDAPHPAGLLHAAGLAGEAGALRLARPPDRRR